MTHLFDEAAPRIFAMPPGADFAADLARGLSDRLTGAGPEALARCQIVVNTQRTMRTMSEAFEALGDAVFLPRIATIDTVANGESDLPPPIDRLARRLVLTRLVEERLRAAPGLGPLSAAGPLADALATLLDEMQREDIPLSALSDAVTPGEDVAARWEQAIEFLGVIRTLWPDFLSADPARSDPMARAAADMQALLARWEDAAPDHPVIAAGSTGSRRMSSDFLVRVAHLPQGAVILPGFDFTMDAEAWERLTPDHPQFGFAELLARLNLTRTDVRPWRERGETPRARLLAEALRPAPVTHRWRAALPVLTAEADASTSEMTLIEAPSPRREAEAIALVMRRALAAGESAALVTPDRSLARRVTAELDRWNLNPDDSSGRPLSLTPPGVFLSMMVPFLAGEFDASAFLALMKHPLCQHGARGPFLGALAELEVKHLRFREAALSLRSIAALEALAVGDEKLALLMPALESLRPWSDGARPLAEMVEEHRQRAEAITGGEVWEQKAGREALSAMARFAEVAGHYGEATPAAYAPLFIAALSEAGDVREEAYLADKRIRILGTQEARSQTADVMILGGLNEGSWPPAPTIDPWLSRPMRERVGLALPERRVGLSAHDFQQAASARKVVMTRALRAGGAPTIRARWLSRLATLLEGVEEGRALAAMEARGAEVLSIGDAMGRVPPPAPYLRPEPRPAASTRPRELYVTDIEQLIRDPYSIYARRILKLRPLDDPGAAPDARLRGEVLHKVVERFVMETKAAVPPGRLADDLYDRLSLDEVAKAAASPALAVAWRARLDRVRDWFLNEERQRRADGDPLATEVQGEVGLTSASGPFILKGRADRVDRMKTGALAIYDYKAGATPSKKQTAVFSKQLPLLATIAEAGGFKDIAAAEVALHAYLSLSGADEGGKEVAVDLEPDAAAGLIQLIEAFEDEARAYIPRAYPEQMKYDSDYDHLSRYGEWDDRPATEAPV